MKKLYALLTVTFLSISAFAQVNLQVGLIGAFPFSGNANDTSGHLQPGVVSLATLANDRFSNSNSSYDFPGFGSNIIVPYAAAMDLSEQLSVSLWINIADVSANQKLIGRCDYAFNSGFIFGIQNDSTYTEVWDATGTRTAFTCQGVVGGSWQHLAFTWKSGGYLVEYVNGLAVDSMLASVNTIGNNSDPLVIGAAPWDQSYFQVTGGIDDIHVYGRQLNAAEVYALYSFIPVAVRELNKPIYASVYPNPSGKEKVNLDLPSSEKIEFVNVTNSIGQEISVGVDANERTIDLSNQSSGMYFIKTITDAHSYISTVIVE